MSVITNLASNGYYQLNGNASNSANSRNATANVRQSLLDALSGNSAAGGNHSDAYLLKLSPAAQQYLNPSANSSPLNPTSSFTLNGKQQQALTDILTKHKDAPFTQDTFKQIQDDMNVAGVGANTLSMQDKAKSFNPTVVLINALTGKSNDDSNNGFSSSAQQQKSGNYIQQVITQWKNMSGNNDVAADAVTAVSTTGEA